MSDKKTAQERARGERKTQADAHSPLDAEMRTTPYRTPVPWHAPWLYYEDQSLFRVPDGPDAYWTPGYEPPTGSIEDVAQQNMLSDEELQQRFMELEEEAYMERFKQGLTPEDEERIRQGLPLVDVLKRGKKLEL